MRFERRTLRAALIALALGFGFIAGWPRPSPKLVARLPPSLASLVARLPELQERLLTPARPFAAAFGVYSQNWPLFSSTGGTRHRFSIEARSRRSGAWTLLYRAHDPEHRYLANTLEYRRLRNLWIPHHQQLVAGFSGLSGFVAGRVFAEFPDYDAVRLRHAELDILDRASGFRERDSIYNEVVVQRDGKP